MLIYTYCSNFLFLFRCSIMSVLAIASVVHKLISSLSDDCNNGIMVLLTTVLTLVGGIYYELTIAPVTPSLWILIMKLSVFICLIPPIMYAVKSRKLQHVPSVGARSFVTLMSMLLLICSAIIEAPKIKEMQEAKVQEISYCPLRLLSSLVKFEPFQSSIRWLQFHLVHSILLVFGNALVQINVIKPNNVTFSWLHWSFVYVIWSNCWNVINLPHNIAVVINLVWLSVMCYSFIIEDWLTYVTALGTSL